MIWPSVWPLLQGRVKQVFPHAVETGRGICRFGRNGGAPSKSSAQAAQLLLESEQGLSQASRLLGKYLLVASGLATSQAGDPKANDDRDAMHWKVS